MHEDIPKTTKQVQLSATVLDVIDRMSVYASTVEDWLRIKTEALRRLPTSERAHFSVRDPYTKQQAINEYEAIFIERWYEKTGVRLTLHERAAS